MPLLEGLDFSDLAEALTALGVDAWLLYDFRRVNPVAGRILGPTGMGTRRLFIFLPRGGGGGGGAGGGGGGARGGGGGGGGGGGARAGARRGGAGGRAAGGGGGGGGARGAGAPPPADRGVRTELRRAALRAARRRGLA